MKTAGGFCSDRAVIRQRIKENRIVRNQNDRAVLNRDRLITLKGNDRVIPINYL